MKETVIPVVIGTFGTLTKGLIKGQGDLEIRGRINTIQRNSIIKRAQNIKKNLGDFRRLAVSQTPVKNHQLTLV